MPVDSRIALSGIAPPLMSMGQLAGLQQIGDERNKQANLVKLNQIPGMVEKGLYTDQGLMALSQIDPALRDRATLMREDVLKSRMEADRKLEEEKVALGTDIAAEAIAKSLEEPNPAARQVVFQKALNEGLDRIEKDGTAAKLGITPEGLKRMRSLSPSDAMLNLQKHGRYTTDQRGDYLAGKIGVQAEQDLNQPQQGGGPMGAPPAQPVQPSQPGAQAQPEGPVINPNQPAQIEGQPISDRPTVTPEEFAQQAAQWDAYAKSISERWQAGQLTPEEYDKETGVIADEQARIQAEQQRLQAEQEAVKSAQMPGAPDVNVTAKEREDLIAKAIDAEKRAAAWRNTGLQKNIKVAEGWSKKADAYRRAADALTRADQKDRQLDQADRRMDISESRMNALMQGADYLPGEIHNMATELLYMGKEPRGNGPAGNKIRQDVRNERSRIMTALGMTAEEAALLPYENKVKMKAIDKMTTWGAFVDKGAEQLNKSLDLAIQYAEKIGPTRMRAINKLIIAGQKEFNDPIASAYAVQANTVRTEYARLLTGPTSNAMLPVEAMKKGDDLIATAMDVPTWREVGKVIRNDAKITRTSIDNQLSMLRSSMIPGSKYAPKEAALEPIGQDKPKPGGPKQGPNSGGGWSKEEIDAEMKRRGIK
jgi:hypothetical protein